MAIWKVFSTQIKLLPHPNADRMEIVQCDLNQLVVGKGQYKDGDIIVFAPERAILPDDLKGEYLNQETGSSYLTGLEQNRVRQIRLRGELSEGVTLPISWVLSKNPEWKTVEDIPLNEDISEILGITKYSSPIPASMGGILKHNDSLNFASPIAHHDVEQFRLFSDEFQLEQNDSNSFVICTCKLHGSQCNVLFSKTGEIGVSSKGLNGKDLIIEKDEKNIYWQALENSGLINFVKCNFIEPESIDLSNKDVQFVGEVIPCQKNFSYGQDKPTIKLFRLRIDGREYSISEIENLFGEQFIKDHWVPILYRGKFDLEVFEKLSKGNECVSGKSLHIKEGIVISPETPRVSRRGFPLYLKFLNPKYKSNDDDLS